MPLTGEAKGREPVATGLWKIILGLGAAGVGAFAAVEKGYDRNAALVAAAALALGVRFVVTGGANVGKRRFFFWPSLGLAALVFGAVFLAAPAASRARWSREEAKVWEEACAEEKTSPARAVSTWEITYGRLPEVVRRPAWTARWLLARVAAAKSAIDKARSRDLRELLGKLEQERESAPRAPRADYDQALAAAHAALRDEYAASIARLEAGEQGHEFAVDPKLRDVMKRMLDDLAGAPDSAVYVAFTSAADLTEPAEAKLHYSIWKTDPLVEKKFPAGDYPVIAPGEAFGPRFEAGRRRMFVKAMADAFSAVFSWDLVQLAELAPGESRAGRWVFEVASHARRAPGYFKYTRNPGQPDEEFVGLLFDVEVDWTFRIHDRSGTLVYESATRSRPAETAEIRRRKTDPEWAPYSVIMDSAYYNYCREITGRFGLLPPGVKKEFWFTGGA